MRMTVKNAKGLSGRVKIPGDKFSFGFPRGHHDKFSFSSFQRKCLVSDALLIGFSFSLTDTHYNVLDFGMGDTPEV